MLNFRPLCSEKILKNSYAFIFRSGELIHLDKIEIEEIVTNLSIKHYIDLRSPSEISLNGSPDLLIEAGINWQVFSMKDDNHYLRTIKFPTGTDYYSYYVHLLEVNKSILREIFVFINNQFHERCIFGCYAGKDRTGIIAFLLLKLFDFHEDDILNDYLASRISLVDNIDYFRKTWEKKGLTKEQYIARITPTKEPILLLCEYLSHKYGSIEGYFNDLNLEIEDFAHMSKAIKGCYNL